MIEKLPKALERHVSAKMMKTFHHFSRNMCLSKAFGSFSIMSSLLSCSVREKSSHPIFACVMSSAVWLSPVTSFITLICLNRCWKWHKYNLTSICWRWSVFGRSRSIYWNTQWLIMFLGNFKGLNYVTINMLYSIERLTRPFWS
jgi:hypothetical protein